MPGTRFEAMPSTGLTPDVLWSRGGAWGTSCPSLCEVTRDVSTQGCPIADCCILVAVLHVPEHPFNPRHCSQTISNIFHLHSDNDMSLFPHIWSAHIELWDFLSAAHMGSGINEIKIPGKNGSWLIQNQALIKPIILVQLRRGKNL